MAAAIVREQGNMKELIVKLGKKKLPIFITGLHKKP
jgi:hypothetical protein